MCCCHSFSSQSGGCRGAIRSPWQSPPSHTRRTTRSENCSDEKNQLEWHHAILTPEGVVFPAALDNDNGFGEHEWYDWG